MVRSAWLSLPLLFVAALLIGVRPVDAGGEKKGEPKHHHEHGGVHEECAKACTRCMRECESCATHCASLAASGKKDHLKTLHTCLDCGDFCGVAAKIVSRHGPMSNTICESCAKACDICGQACDAHNDDEHMARCAKACHECAKACRDMIRASANPQG